MKTNERNQSRDWLRSRGASGFSRPSEGGLASAQPLQEAQVDQDVDERVLIGDGGAIAQMWAFDAQGPGLGVDALHGGALAVEIFVWVAVAVEGVAEARPDAGRHHRATAALLPLFVVDWASLGGAGGEAQRTDVFTPFVFDKGLGAIGVGEFEGHRQAGGADREAGGIKAPAIDFDAAFFGEGNGGEAGGGVVFAVKVGVNVPSVEGGIKGGKGRAITKAVFDLAHQGEEVRQIALIEGLGQLGEDEFAPAGDLGDDDAGAIAPIELADLERRSRPRLGGRGDWSALIVAALAAETTIGITGGLAGLIEAVGDVGFGVVLGDPGQDVFGIERDTGDRRSATRGEFGPDQAHGVGQEELQGSIGERTQEAREVSGRRQAGPGLETNWWPGCGRGRETEQGYETRMLSEATMQVLHRGEMLIELDQAGGGESGERDGGLAPAAGEVAFREVSPVERAKELEQTLNGGIVGDARGLGVGVEPEVVQIQLVLWLFRGQEIVGQERGLGYNRIVGHGVPPER